MFKIKICGVTTVEDAIAAARFGADAIGLNFYPKSKRFIPIEQASKISKALRNLEHPPRVVGVFVNESPERICEISEQSKLDSVQLHGDESPSALKELQGLSVVKAFRCKNHIGPAVDWLQAAANQQGAPKLVLLDAFHPGEYGGTGETIDLDEIRDQISQLNGIPWVLAGGLKPENVRAAIRSIHPDAVDTASGVESTPGKKCHSKTERFIREAKVAFAAIQNET